MRLALIATVVVLASCTKSPEPTGPTPTVTTPPPGQDTPPAETTPPDSPEPAEPDGSCTTPADCEGLVHIMCVGAWSCDDGRCNYECGSAPAP